MLAIASLGIAAVWVMLRPREPEFGGRRLSEWLAEIGQWYPEEPPNAEASTAIQTIGTAAIPFLLKDLQAKPYPWEHLPGEIATRLSDSMQLPTASARNDRALVGFRALGGIATPAIPELNRLAKGEVGANPVYAIYAIGMIGTDEILPVLLEHLASTNANRQAASIGALADMGERAAVALPAIRTNLGSPDRTVRQFALYALPRIASLPDKNLISQLAGLLTDSDKHIQRSAIQALTRYAPNAASTAPALETLIEQSTDKITRRWAQQLLVLVQCKFYQGGIIRGPEGGKSISLVLTGHEYAEGAGTMLDELSKRQAKASWFVTGDFVRNPNLTPLVVRAAKAGHLIGPHSDKHLLYCAWQAGNRTLVSAQEFARDVLDNRIAIRLAVSPKETGALSPEEELFEKRYGIGPLGFTSDDSRYFLPAFEHYNQEIVDWTKEQGLTLINFTPGTRSNADYTGEADTNFVSSQAIFDSILLREREDPHGLNGFILLLHLGSGPRRADKFHTRFGELLDVLAAKGYQFVRVDELLEPPKEEAK